MNYSEDTLNVTLTTTGDSIIAYFDSANWTYTPPTGFVSLDVCNITIANSIDDGHTDPVTPVVAQAYAKATLVPHDASGRYAIPAQPLKYVYGTILEQKLPAAKTVRAYDSATGKLVTETISDPTTGFFTLPAIGSPKVDIVAKDAPNYQAQIFDELTPQ